jgi:transcriptional regulator with XRE-family HTH domain
MELIINPNNIKNTLDPVQETAKLRGVRLQRLRNLANLSRREMCEGASAHDLNPNTLKGWEIGRYGGLTVKGAHRVLDRIRSEGVVCTLEWLLHEWGPGPGIIQDYSKIKHLEAMNEPFIWGDEEEQIAKEALLFRSFYKRTIETMIQDDGMLPLYHPGEYVAGVACVRDKIFDLIEENCIIITDEGSTLVRKIRQGNKKNTFHLICINTESSVEQPILYDVKISVAAPIIWHRRKEKRL